MQTGQPGFWLAESIVAEKAISRLGAGPVIASGRWYLGVKRYWKTLPAIFTAAAAGRWCCMEPRDAASRPSWRGLRRMCAKRSLCEQIGAEYGTEGEIPVELALTRLFADRLALYSCSPAKYRVSRLNTMTYGIAKSYILNVHFAISPISPQKTDSVNRAAQVRKEDCSVHDRIIISSCLFLAWNRSSLNSGLRRNGSTQTVIRT